MKKILLLTGCILVFSATYAQILISLVFGDKLNSGNIEFGLDGGYSLSGIRGIDGAENRSGFNLGFYFDIKTKHPSWMVSTGVVVKGPMGAKGLPLYSLEDPVLSQAFEGGSVTRQLGYFYVPVTMKYSFKNRIYLKGGIQMGLINKGVDEFINSVFDEDDLTFKIKRRSDFHPLDGGLVAGAGYRLLGGYGMNIGITYYYGLVDAMVDDSSPNQYNKAMYFNVGIPIGKAKAEKRAAEKQK